MQSAVFNGAGLAYVKKPVHPIRLHPPSPYNEPRIQKSSVFNL